MGTPGYGDYLLVFIGSFLAGFLMGWKSRNTPRIHRMKQALVASLTLASFYPLFFLVIAFTSVSNPLSYSEGLVAFCTHLASTFLAILLLIGMPLTVGFSMLNPKKGEYKDQ